MTVHMKTMMHTSQIHVRHGSNIVARIHFGKVPVPRQRALPLPSVLTDAVSHADLNPPYNRRNTSGVTCLCKHTQL